MKMNIINKITVFAAAILLSVGCMPEYLEVDQTKVPQAADIDAVYEINNETNEVTFSIRNKEMVPVWVVENEIVNGRKTNKNYTGNNLTLLFNERGEHIIHVKAYNAHGMSVGQKPVTFTLENYVSYDKGLKGWDPDEGTNLWRSAVKTNYFFYYAPGWSQIADPSVEVSGNDYVLTLPAATTDQWQAQVAFTQIGIATTADKTYDFQVVLKSNNDLPGVTIKLTHADDDNVFYCADRHQIPADQDFLYQLANIPGQDMPDLDLFFDFGGNPENTVVDIKQIIISEHQENHVIKDDSGKWNADIDANMWKTAVTNQVTCWFANNDWGQISDPSYVAEGGAYEVTIPEGMGSSQWQGQFAVNHTGISLAEGKKYDFQFVLKSDADHPGVTIKPCNGVDGSNDDPFMADGRHVLKAGEEYLYQLADVAGKNIPDLKVVFDFGGGVAGSVVVISDIIICEHQDGHVVKAEDPNKNTLFDAAAPENMWLTANTTEWTYYYAPGWSQIDNPTVSADGNFYIVTLPAATTEQWQAQMFFNNLGISTQEGKKYDFQAILKSNNDHPGVTVKLVSTASDSDFYFDKRHKLVAGETYVYQESNLEGKNLENLKLVLDFGGCAADTEVEIKDIIFQEHREK